MIGTVAVDGTHKLKIEAIEKIINIKKPHKRILFLWKRRLYRLPLYLIKSGLAQLKRSNKRPPKIFERVKYESSMSK